MIYRSSGRVRIHSKLVLTLLKGVRTILFNRSKHRHQGIKP